MKRYLLIFVLIGAALGMALGLTLARPTAEAHGSESDTASNAAPKPKGQTRTYYIAADEVQWDYAPSGTNQITGKAFDDEANVFVENGSDRIGKVYLKSQYREYTNESFTTLKAIPDRWKHKGILGPVIQAEVGDTIVVVFKNNTRFAASIHPHGVFYQKDSEGAGYDDGTTGADKDDD